MGNKSSLLLREEEIAQIQDETGCEYECCFHCFPSEWSLFFCNNNIIRTLIITNFNMQLRNKIYVHLIIFESIVQSSVVQS